MRIAVGSTRPSKVAAVKEAWEVFGSHILQDPEEKVEFLAYDVGSRVPSMPLSVEELMQGAEGRVENLALQLKREQTGADYYIGLEGGFHTVDMQGPRRRVFLESWAYVSDGHRGSYGHGGGIPVPDSISSPVIDRGIELGIVIDRFSGQTDVRSEQGTWGVLSKDILDRKHSFVVALIAAFAPFYNSEAYGK